MYRWGVEGGERHRVKGGAGDGTSSGAGGQDPEPESWGPQKAPLHQARGHELSQQAPTCILLPRIWGGGRGNNSGE